MFQIEVVDNTEELSKYKDEWNNLVFASKEGDIFQTYEWVSSWLESFWENKPIRFLFIRRQGNLVALAPFVKDERGELWCPNSLVTPINSESKRTTIVYSGDAQEIFDAIITYITKTQNKIRVIFRHALKTSTVVQILPHIAENHKLLTLSVEKASSPILHINCDWETYLKSKSRQFKRELRRKQERLEEEGQIDWITHTNTEHLDQAIQDLLFIERNSWKQKEKTSITAEPSQTKFYTTLARKCAENGWLRMHILYLNSRPLAHSFGVVFKKEYYTLKTSYNSAFQTIAPGSVLFNNLIRDAFDRKFVTIDFLGGEAPWKLKYTNDLRRHVNICIFSRNQYRCIYCNLYQSHLKPFIKKAMPFLPKIKEWIQKNLVIS